MTVDELIERLKNYPGDMRVLTLGYEGGFNDSMVWSDDIVFNVHDKNTWYYGPHESQRFVDGATSGTKCVIIGRGK